jgi:adenylosuccinate synthase
MTSVVIVGTQFGDEGKGKIVDILTEFADMVVRYSGGPNAGHTLVVNNKKTIVRLIPSGILRENTICVLAQGMVIDPSRLITEINELDKLGFIKNNSLLVSEHAHMILPYHVLIDELREKTSDALGTTKKGIGPCYEDKIARRGVTIGSLKDLNYAYKLIKNSLLLWKPVITNLGGIVPSAEKIIRNLEPLTKIIVPLISNTSKIINDTIANNKNVLFEGAQGTLLDVDHGTYPYVTSSSAIAGGACTGAGIGPSRIDSVIGITKSYCTRVGSGPFPTELNNDIGKQLQNIGQEFGSVTGRPRRTGWLDIPLLQYATRVNGLDSLAITKLDVLSRLDEIKVCVAYRENHSIHNLENVEPVYKTFPGWKQNISNVKSFDDLPQNAKDYIRFISDTIECPISIISIGCDRNDTIMLNNPCFN